MHDFAKDFLITDDNNFELIEHVFPDRGCKKEIIKGKEFRRI